jgi:hypothetical protein
MTLGWLRFHDSKLPPPRMNARHDFSYVLFRAALGAFGVFLIIGIDLDDHILIMLGGVCMGLVSSRLLFIWFISVAVRKKRLRHLAGS